MQHAFGLTLLADEPLPGLAGGPAAGGAEVRVHLRRLPAWLTAEAERAAAPWPRPAPPPEDGEPPLDVRRLAGGALLLRYRDGVRFVLDAAGREVWADWPAAHGLDYAATYLVGPVLGLLLRLRGVLALHAAAVAVGGRALVLAGPAEAGKSTLAAAFARAGHPVLADDVAALDEAGGGFRVLPAFPRLRLWPDAAEALFGRADALPRLAEGWEKRALDLAPGAGFQPEPLPLAAVYLLGARSEEGPRVEPLSGGAPLVSLAALTYAAPLLDAGMRRDEFAALARLVRQVPVRAAVPHLSPARLAALVDALAADSASLTL
ncbi:MAG TPA: hypothetical protein VFX98_13115 [Longimicrobiaceae bacterium]|nr:hypothetical protein [Longimicrobiaceae bacterium]